MSDTCTSCGAEIVWLEMVTQKGERKRHPFDAKTVKGWVTDDRGLVSRDVYTSHFATCPNANQHRKPKENVNA